MSNYFVFINYFLITVLYLFGLFLQEISEFNKRSLFYGVRIPIGYETKENLVVLHKKYKRNISLSFLMVLVALTPALYFSPEEIAAIALVPETFIWLAVLAANYLFIHKKVKKLGFEENWKFDNNVVIIDTSYRENTNDNKISISSRWFLVPLTILFITLAGMLIEVNITSNSSSQRLNLFDEGFPAFMLFIMQVVLNIIFFINHKIMQKTKQSLNGGRIGEIKFRSRKTRYILSIGYLAITIYINLLLMLVIFCMCNILSQAILTSSIYVSLIIPVGIGAAMIFAAAKSTKNVNYKSKSEIEEEVVNTRDDSHYKFGTIYYNENDPSLFVEKRFGLGFSLNFARPAAKVFMGVIALIIIGTIVLISFMPGMTRERQVDVSGEMISVSGVWGTDIKKEQIEKITLETTLPSVITKTNGADIGYKLFGHHKLVGYDNAVLFLIDKTKPFVAIYLKDGSLILINYADKAKTEMLYRNINSTLNPK